MGVAPFFLLDLHSDDDPLLPVAVHLHSYEPTVFTHVADGWHV